MLTQYVRTPVNYKTCTVKVHIPKGMNYDGIILVREDAKKHKLNIREGIEEIPLDTPEGGQPIRISNEDGVVPDHITVTTFPSGAQKLSIFSLLIKGALKVGSAAVKVGTAAVKGVYQGGKYIVDKVFSKPSVQVGASVEINDEIDLGLNMEFKPIKKRDLGDYYVSLREEPGLRRKSAHKYVLLFSFASSSLNVIPQAQEYLPTQTFRTFYVNLSCTECYVKKILLKTEDAIVNLVSPSKYKFYKMDNFTMLELRLEKLMFEDFGLYFMFVHLAENYKEKIKFLTVYAPDADDENLLGNTRLVQSVDPGDQLEETMKYGCKDCDVSEVLCQGQNFIESGRVTIIPHRKQILFNLPSFEDSHSCVYTALFTKESKVYRKIIAVIDNKSDLVSISPPHLVIPAPPLGDEDEPMKHAIQYKCKARECSVVEVRLNGIVLTNDTDSSDVIIRPFYELTDNTITLMTLRYVPMISGVSQAVFNVDGVRITKTIMEIR